MDEEYVEAVLDLVAQVPPGRATTYGALAEAVGQRLGRGGPRQVGWVLAHYGGPVPWWRVVSAGGRLAPSAHADAAARLRAEGCPLRRGPDGWRADLAAARWSPP